jgi:hypothetical protein
MRDNLSTPKPRPQDVNPTRADVAPAVNTTTRSDYKATLRWTDDTGLWEQLRDAPDDDAAWQLLLNALKRTETLVYILHTRPAATGRAAWDETLEELRNRFEADLANATTSSRASGRGSRGDEMMTRRAPRLPRSRLDPAQREHELSEAILTLMVAASRYGGSDTPPRPTAKRLATLQHVTVLVAAAAMTKAAVSEARIADLKAKTGRSCGSCSLCCKLVEVDDPPFFKPAGKWCPHCRPGNGGCTIYDQRPTLCRVWACDWLVRSELSDEWQPTRCKMVVAPGKVIDGHACCDIHVDPGSPDAWRREPYHSQIRAWALNGLRGVNGVTITTRVSVGRRLFVILPDDDVEVTDAARFVIVPVGPDQWRVVQFESEEQAQRWNMAATALMRASGER